MVFNFHEKPLRISFSDAQIKEQLLSNGITPKNYLDLLLKSYVNDISLCEVCFLKLKFPLLDNFLSLPAPLFTVALAFVYIITLQHGSLKYQYSVLWLFKSAIFYVKTRYGPKHLWD